MHDERAHRMRLTFTRVRLARRRLPATFPEMAVSRRHVGGTARPTTTEESARDA